MARTWFVQKDDVVEGPLSTEDIQSRMQSGLLTASHRIWGRGLDGWTNLTTWVSDLPNMDNAEFQDVTPPDGWHYAIGGQSHGPMIRELLIQELKGLEWLGSVMLWCKGMKEWTPLFEFHEMLSEIGVNKRQFPRADLTGKVIFKHEGSTLTAPLLTISEGGFSMALDGGLTSGEIITAELHSPMFRDIIHLKAEVRYLAEGYAGMKFTQIPVEAKGAIVQFVRHSQMRFTLKAA